MVCGKSFELKFEEKFLSSVVIGINWNDRILRLAIKTLYTVLIAGEILQTHGQTHGPLDFGL